MLAFKGSLQGYKLVCQLHHDLQYCGKLQTNMQLMQSQLRSRYGRFQMLEITFYQSKFELINSNIHIDFCTGTTYYLQSLVIVISETRNFTTVSLRFYSFKQHNLNSLSHLSNLFLCTKKNPIYFCNTWRVFKVKRSESGKQVNETKRRWVMRKHLILFNSHKGHCHWRGCICSCLHLQVLLFSKVLYYLFFILN